jgi:type IV pilus assembly protein PilA
VRDERGFTLIELMVVVMIIGVLVAIGLPTFLGTRTRAYDAAAHSDIRNAFAAEKAFYSDNATYTTDPATMTSIEAAITYVDGDTPLATDVVYLDLDAITRTIYVSALSKSGICYYLREINGAGAGFASDPACGVADTQAYNSGW